MNYHYLTVDGELSGTGVRDSINGGYVDLADLGVSPALISQIERWKNQYEKSHYDSYNDGKLVSQMDSEGIEICKSLRKELSGSKIDYFSAAQCKKILFYD